MFKTDYLPQPRNFFRIVLARIFQNSMKVFRIFLNLTYKTSRLSEFHRHFLGKYWESEAVAKRILSVVRFYNSNNIINIYYPFLKTSNWVMFLFYYYLVLSLLLSENLESNTRSFPFLGFILKQVYENIHAYLFNDVFVHFKHFKTFRNFWEYQNSSLDNFTKNV